MTAFLAVGMMLAMLAQYPVGLILGENLRLAGAATPDKVAKMFMMAAFLPAMLSGSEVRWRRGVGWQMLAILGLVTGFVMPYVLRPGTGYDHLRAQKEIIRLVGFCAIFFLVAGLRLRLADWRALFRWLVLFGGVTAILAVRHSIVGGKSTEFERRIVEGFLRAGTGLIPVNQLGALMNFVSLLALAGFVLDRGPWQRAYYLMGMVLGQVGRFATFSNGSAVGLLVSLIALVLLVSRRGGRLRRRVLGVILGLGLIGWISLELTGYKEVFLYRLLLADDVVLQSSVMSRLQQYEALWRLFRTQAGSFVMGFGTARLVPELGVGIDLHNSLLRPFAAAGILGGVSYVILLGACLYQFVSALSSVHKGSEERFLVAVLYSGFLGWFVQSLTLPADTDPLNWFYFLLAYMIWRTVQEGVRIRPEAVRAGGSVACGALARRGPGAVPVGGV